MNAEKPKYTEIADTSILMRVQINPAPIKSVVTTTMPYESVKHLLSNKPLRRPNRNRLSEKSE